MKRCLAIVILWILCAGRGSPAEAVCGGTSVNAFGAKGDGATDDTSAIQNAINAAAAAGGGLVFNVARYNSQCPAVSQEWAGIRGHFGLCWCGWQTVGSAPDENRFTVSRTSQTGVPWCPFRGQK
jgi:Pectate lyase superfamily protein